MKRPGLALAVVAILGLGTWAITRLLVSEETRIGWLLDDVAESFNAASLGGCLEAFHPDFRDKNRDKTMLRAALFTFFRSHRDGKTRRFLYRVRAPEPSRTIRIESENEAHAALAVYLEVQESEGSNWQEAWTVVAELRLEKLGDEWRILGSSHETIAGKRPR